MEPLRLQFRRMIDSALPGEETAAADFSRVLKRSRPTHRLRAGFAIAAVSVTTAALLVVLLTRKEPPRAPADVQALTRIRVQVVGEGDTRAMEIRIRKLEDN